MQRGLKRGKIESIHGVSVTELIRTVRLYKSCDEILRIWTDYG